MVINKKNIDRNLEKFYTKTEIRILNFSTGKNNYTFEELKSQTVKDLRSLAKSHKIPLSGAKKKDEIVNVMFAYYLQVKSSESTLILPGTFDILTNDNNDINVSIWFQGKG